MTTERLLIEIPYQHREGTVRLYDVGKPGFFKAVYPDSSTITVPESWFPEATRELQKAQSPTPALKRRGPPSVPPSLADNPPLLTSVGGPFRCTICNQPRRLLHRCPPEFKPQPSPVTAERLAATLPGSAVQSVAVEAPAPGKLPLRRRS